MKYCSILLIVTWITLLLERANAFENGKYEAVLTNGKKVYLARTLYKDSVIRMNLTRKELCSPETAILSLKWVLRSTSCYTEYGNIEKSLGTFFTKPYAKVVHGGEGEYLDNGGTGEKVDCSEASVPLKDLTTKPWTKYPVRSENKTNVRRKRDENSMSASQIVAKVPSDALYLLIISIDGTDNFTYIVNVEMESPKGYLSAVDYPFLPFYGAMVCFYSLFTIYWLLVILCKYKSTTRVHYLIACTLVISLFCLGMNCYVAMHYNSYGSGVSKSAEIFLSIVCALKSTLFRVLLITLSMGFAISRTNQYKAIVVVGIVYAFLFLVLFNSSNPGTKINLYTVLLGIIAVLDLIISFWIFINLLRAIKLFKLRSNSEQLARYRRFTIVLGVCMLAFFSFLIKKAFDDTCISDWKYEWLRVAFWEVLDFVVMFSVVILWRPIRKDKSVSFSRLTNEEGEDEEQVLFDNAEMGENFSRPIDQNVTAEPYPEEEQPAVMEVN